MDVPSEPSSEEEKYSKQSFTEPFTNVKVKPPEENFEIKKSTLFYPERHVQVKECPNEIYLVTSSVVTSEIKAEDLFVNTRDLTSIKEDLPVQIKSEQMDTSILTTSVKDELVEEIKSEHLLSEEWDLPTIKSEIVDPPCTSQNIGKIISDQNTSKKNSKRFPCPVCSKTFMSPSSRNIHLELHFSKSMVICSCGSMYTKKVEYLAHYLRHSVNKSSTFNQFHGDTTVDQVRGDTSSDDKAKIFVKSEVSCDNASETQEIKKFAYIIKKGDVFKCAYCPKESPEPINLQFHLRIHGVKDGYECGFCFRKFRRVLQLERHVCHQNIIKKKIRKEKVTEERQTYKCDQCSRVFVGKRWYTAHFKTHTKSRCRFCFEHFFPAQELRKHILLVHEGKELCKCELCPKEFLSNRYLKRHLRATHFQVTLTLRLFSCYICREKFSKRQYLERHVLSYHKEERSLSCSICCKEFYSEQSLTQHLMVDHCIYECKTCAKTFSVKSTFYAHNNTVHRNLFKCNICSKKLADRRRLQKHLRLIHSVYDCEICPEIFSSKLSFDKHFDIHKTINCTYCSETFINRLSFDRHVRYIHDGAEKYKCKICSKEFLHRSNLNCHMDNHNGTRYPCKICSKTFSHRSSLNRHTVSVHGGFSHNKIMDNEEPSKCQMCSKTFSKSAYLKKHLQIHAAVKPYSCTICPKKFYHNANLRSHVQSVHEPVKQFKCDICLKEFALKSRLVSHMVIHSHDTPHSCEICWKVFRQRRNYLEHMITHTDAKPFECDVCSRKFSQKRYLKDHMKLHGNDKPFECKICFNKYVDGGRLSNHMKTHIDKPFCCKVCLTSFPEQSVLDEHVKLHDDETVLKCEICSKLYTTKVSYDRHMITHLGVKRYECEICSKAFVYKARLRKHLVVHESLKPYNCEVCCKGFAWKTNYKRHLQYHERQNKELEIETG